MKMIRKGSWIRLYDFIPSTSPSIGPIYTVETVIDWFFTEDDIVDRNIKDASVILLINPNITYNGSEVKYFSARNENIVDVGEL